MVFAVVLSIKQGQAFGLRTAYFTAAIAITCLP
jgi:hypothetical protein